MQKKYTENKEIRYWSIYIQCILYIYDITTSTTTSTSTKEIEKSVE